MALRFDNITFDTSFDDTGDPPEAWIMYTTDDAAEPTPTWVDASAKVLSFSTSRGRETELEEVNAGTATITLDNRTRVFDPAHNSAIKPMNRWRIYAQHAAETQAIFVGYADSYEQTWPAPVGDAQTVVACTDEFKVLSLDNLPVMTPPRDTYKDLVASDVPGAYWSFDDFNNLGGNPGTAWFVPGSGGYGVGVSTAIIGESSSFGGQGRSLFMQTGSLLNGDASDWRNQGASEITIEFWFGYSALPGGDTHFLAGPFNSANTIVYFQFMLLTTGKIRFRWVNSGLTDSALDTAAAIPSDNSWHHIVGTLSGGTQRIYVDGVQSNSVGAAGTLFVDDSGDPPQIAGISGVTYAIDELVFYPARDIGATRILAHYQAGRQRGFINAQSPLKDGTSLGVRFESILDSAESAAPRSRTGGSTRLIQGAFMHGQDVLGELRTVTVSEKPDGLLFVSRSGTITALGNDHRSASPYNTVQATFDDDGTDLPYAGLDLDYSESFLTNEWAATAKGSQVTATASDSTSIDKYFKRSQSLTDIPVTTDGYASDIAAAMLAKYKDPLTRITRITLTTAEPAVATAAFARDIGDRIRVFRTPPGGGSRIDQTLFIQKISVEGNAQGPWRIEWAVSPV